MKKKKLNTYAKTSFILSLFFWIPLLNIITSALAIGFGVAALKEIKNKNDKRSKTFAIFGITLGITAIVIYILGNIYLLVTRTA